jgi:hypothetical protein
MTTMSDEGPIIRIIAGPNGSGKTTFAWEFLPRFADMRRFINADLIAAGLSPFEPSAAAITAGRLMLDEIQRLAEQRLDFAFETTFSGPDLWAENPGISALWVSCSPLLPVAAARGDELGARRRPRTKGGSSRARRGRPPALSARNHEFLESLPAIGRFLDPVRELPFLAA